MGNKVIYERFAWFDDRIRRGKHPGASSLARKFEISRKTAQRDIEFMRDRLNCPLIYDKSKKGYYYPDNEFIFPLTYLSSKEIASLLFAKKLIQDINGGYIQNDIFTIINKISSVLDNHVQFSGEIENAVSFQPIRHLPVQDEIFRIVLNTCINRKCLKFTYYSPWKDETSNSTIDPYHLLNYMGKWHLIAYCHNKRAIRDFVLNRVSNLIVIERDFTVNEGFDISKYLQSAFGIFKGKNTKQITLKFSPRMSKIAEREIWHQNQKKRFLKDGSLELSFPVSSFEEVKMEILGCGADVEVIKPKTLRDLIKSEVHKITKIY